MSLKIAILILLYSIETRSELLLPYGINNGDIQLPLDSLKSGIIDLYNVYYADRGGLDERSGSKIYVFMDANCHP